MAINLTLYEVKQQALTYNEMDTNFKELATKLAPLDSPLFTGKPRFPFPGNNADPAEAAPVGFVRQLVSGAQADGNLSYALLGGRNVFTERQIVPDAVELNEAVNLGQVNNRTFQSGDLKWSLWPQNVSLGWVNLAGQLLPDPNSTDPTKSLYAKLFAAIGYGYGGSAAEKAFRVPDARARMLISATNNTGPGVNLSARNAGASGGEELHFLGYNEMVDHQHNFSAVSNSAFNYTFLPASGANGAANGVTGYPAQATTGMLSRGGQTPFNVMNPFLAVYLLCKL